MSVQPTPTTDEAVDRCSQVCSAPSCWEAGDRIEIDGDDIQNPPVLCETHQKCYLGVST